MSRIARKYYNSSFFHVIVQGLNREKIFNEECNVKKYLQLINKYNEKLNIRIISYCIMTNHAHFLFFIDNINNLSNIMQNVNTVYARYYNKKNNRVGYVFRDRFLSQPIDSERYLIKCINYIHNNPVKANIVTKPEEYKYSTYKDFCNCKKIKELNSLTGLKFDINQFKEENVIGYFLDIDINKDEIIKNAIIEFCRENRIKIDTIFEVRETLKKLIKKLKSDYKIKYVDIMKILDIPKGVMKLLK